MLLIFWLYNEIDQKVMNYLLLHFEHVIRWSVNILLFVLHTVNNVSVEHLVRHPPFVHQQKPYLHEQDFVTLNLCHLNLYLSPDTADTNTRCLVIKPWFQGLFLHSLKLCQSNQTDSRRKNSVWIISTTEGSRRGQTRAGLFLTVIYLFS